jgi:hypothetical protein
VNAPHKSKQIRRLLLQIAIGVLILIVISLLLLFPPTSIVEIDVDQRLSRLSTDELAKAKNDVRGTLLQAIAGLILVTGVYATLRQLQLGRDQLHATQIATQEQLRLSREG